MRAALVDAMLHPRSSPDEARFGVAASITSYLQIVCSVCNIAFIE